MQNHSTTFITQFKQINPMKTFTPGDYCRFKNEEIPTIIALLKANGWDVEYTDNENIDAVGIGMTLNFDDKIVFLPIYERHKLTNELSKHDFIVTALRLNEGDGLRADMSTIEQRKHISNTLKKLGVKVGELTNVKTIGVGLNFNNTEICFFGTRNREINHIPYSEWCKRLNETPIGDEQVVFRNSSISEKYPKDLAYFINHSPDVGEKVFPSDECKHDSQKWCSNCYEKNRDKLINPSKQILTLTDGTTVDLTKPFEVRTDKGEWLDIFDCYVGFNNHSGCHIVSSPHSMNSFKHIRNKPEEVKPTTLSELGDSILSEAFHILFGSTHKMFYSDSVKADEMRCIFKGNTQPCAPFENWTKCIEFLNSKLPTI